ncbi:MlaE family ABC transporter permease [Thiohalorhabdus sp. Cl-TMA]|uniref:MlaE family ABC transporter permease n=1 Tax=Thiohalorhabdus methylotrophus TaxID=3242694 RepID=A0ABV4TXM6_9GAMM
MATQDADIRIFRDQEPARAQIRGYWDFLNRPENRRTVQEQLAELERAGDLQWDLRSVEALDSAGALALWRAWGRQYPTELVCRERHRRIFERMQALPEGRPKFSRSPIDLLARPAKLPVAAARGTWELALHFGMIALAAGYAVLHPRSVPWMELTSVIYRAGFRASGLVAVINLVVGMMAAYQIGQALTRFASNIIVVGAFSTAVLREIGPWVTAIIVAGRSGSGIAAEIGSMRLTGELSALRAFGISPILRLAFPRVLGLAIVVPLLVLLGNMFSLLGGMVISDPVLGIPPSQFLDHLPNDVQIINFWIGEVKSLGNGIIIGGVSTYYGLMAASNTESLSRQTISSVVMSLALVLILNAGVGALYVDTGLP